MDKQERKKNRYLGWKAHEAILQRDVCALRSLLAQGLDLNNIDVSRLRNSYTERYYKFCSGAPLRLSALHIVFTNINDEIFNTQSEEFKKLCGFLTELKKLGYDFTRRYWCFDAPRGGGDNASDMVIHSQNLPFETQKALLVFMSKELGIKPSKCHSVKYFPLYDLKSKEPNEDGHIESRANEFTTLYSLEQAAGCDFYTEEQRRTSSVWYEECFCHSPQNEGETYIPVKKSFGDPEAFLFEKATLSSRDVESMCLAFIDSGEKLTINMFTKIKDWCECDPDECCKRMPVLHKLLSSCDFYKDEGNDDLARAYQEILSFIISRIVNRRANDSIDKINSERKFIVRMNSLLESFKDTPELADTIEYNTKVDLPYHYVQISTPIHLPLSTLRTLCEKLKKQGRRPVYLFSRLADDLFLPLRILLYWGDSQKNIDNYLDTLPNKLDLLQSYGWDVNGPYIYRSVVTRASMLHHLMKRRGDGSIDLADHIHSDAARQILHILYEKGLDFSIKNDEGKTAADTLVNADGSVDEDKRGLFDLLKEYERRQISDKILKDGWQKDDCEEIELSW